MGIEQSEAVGLDDETLFSRLKEFSDQTEVAVASEGDSGSTSPSGEGQPADAVTQAVEKPAAEAPKAEPGVEKPTAEAPKIEAPTGVASKDGKHVLPFEVLEGERSRRAEAERTLAEVSNQSAQLQAELDRLKAGGNANAATSVQSKAQLDALKESVQAFVADHPVMGELFTKVLGTVENLQSQVDSYETRDRERVDAVRRSSAQTAQEQADAAAGANADLVLWQEKAPEAHALAAKLDMGLRQDPYWQKQGFAKRFAEAVRRTREEITDAPVPTKAPETTQPQIPAKGAGVAPVQAEPKTISDLGPGGVLPATSAMESFVNLPVRDMQQRFAEMSDEAMLETLSRVR
jgi:hypothetical protein